MTHWEAPLADVIPLLHGRHCDALGVALKVWGGHGWHCALPFNAVKKNAPGGQGLHLPPIFISPFCLSHAEQTASLSSVHAET